MPSQPVLGPSIAEEITYLENAMVVPPPKGDQNRSVQKSGVLTADGAFEERSITWRNTTQVNTEPPMPEDADIQSLPGTWMFAGPLFGHFGHFLVESIARLWAVETLKGKIDGIVFVPKFQNRPQHTLSVFQPMLEGLGVDVKILNLEDPTRVEKLYVPQQGFGMFQMIEGAPEFRDFINKHAGHGVEPDGPEKIYISRSALPPARGSLLGEARLEALLEAEGYTIYHPQKDSFEKQMATYKAARYVISVDGSPLHMTALVGNQQQKIACIARRKGDLDEIFARQFKAFKNVEVTTVSALVQDWIPETDNRPSRVSFGEVDFGVLYDRLKAGGFISGEERWAPFDDDSRKGLLEDLATSQKVGFKPFRKS
ncbi:glycosyltransferase family 61 protein [Salipiger sp. IMCC34102]|uniref:glycosyltransferase family 61 protein n=1 Tax=Salipiger sp. IMCC34102 TaxID=2510647 RepID=UPI00101D970D|nr:glycosyltransferase family 61 protein [Salipiger sp. IMCC34102]RYH00975.1 glycosyltransferase family 61 protein [Salipiger sp. IMCC34102]